MIYDLLVIVDLRINETRQIGAVKNSAYQIWGRSVFLFLEFTIIGEPFDLRHYCGSQTDRVGG